MPALNLSSMADNSPGGMIGLVCRFVLRFLQFLLAIVVIGLYAQDLNDDYTADAFSRSKWGYAVAIGALSAITCLVYAIPPVPTHILFPWDAVLFILWVAVFGVFGALYINPDADRVSPKDGSFPDVSRMKSAVWVDLVNMLLWFITMLVSIATFFIGRRSRRVHTGIAKA